MSFSTAEPQWYSFFFLSAWSIHVNLRSRSSCIHVVPSRIFGSTPNQHTSYSFPFFPLRRESSSAIWPCFWLISSASSSLSSMKFFAAPSRSIPPAKRHSM